MFLEAQWWSHGYPGVPEREQSGQGGEADVLDDTVPG